MSTYFQHKVVLVTGASRGIGRGVALAFAREGARLVLAARSADRLAKVETTIHALAGQAISVPTDVTSPSSVEAMVETGPDCPCAVGALRRPAVGDKSWHHLTPGHREPTAGK